jgi:Protein of unknown function (DUF760)
MALLPAFAAPLAMRAATPLAPARSRCRQAALKAPRAVRLRRARVVCALGGSPARSDDGSRDAEFELEDEPLGGGGAAEKNELFEFVKTVSPPEMVARFNEAAPSVVQTAIRQTIVSMLGSLPSAAFMPRVTTVSANLVQLFHSALISGYMMRNASYRLELTRNLGGGGGSRLPQLAGAEATPEIIGGEAVFKADDGTEVRIPVSEYVSELRNQVNELRGELARERKGGNELLSYISTLEKESLETLTNNAGPDVVDAMKRVVAEVTMAQEIPPQPDAIVDASSSELGQVLLYLMCCGFTLRETEVRVELQRNLEGKTTRGNNLIEGGKPDPGSQPANE